MVIWKTYREQIKRWGIISLVFCLLYLLQPGFLKPALAETVTLYPTADAQISKVVQNNQNFGSGELAWFGEWSTNDYHYYEHFLVKFDHTQIPEYATINSAKLYLYERAKLRGSLPIPISVKRITSSWQENSVTWNTKPAYNSTPQITGIVGIALNQYYEIPVTELFKGWYKYSYTNQGMYIMPSSNMQTEIGLGTRESSENTRPKLVVDYTPYRPPTLTPTPFIKIIKKPTPTIPVIRTNAVASTPTPTPFTRVITRITPTIPPIRNILPDRPTITNREVVVEARKARLKISVDQELMMFIAYAKMNDPEQRIFYKESAEYATYHEIPLEDLEPATMYSYRVEVKDRNGAYTTFWLPEQFTTLAEESTPVPPDIVAQGGCNDSEDFAGLTIANLSLTSTTDGAIVEWDTTVCQSDGTSKAHETSEWVYVDQNADVSKDYRTYEHNYGKDQLVSSPHRVVVKFLKPNTTYKFRVYSKDTEYRDAVSNMGEFTTLSADGSIGDVVEEDETLEERVGSVFADVPFIGSFLSGNDTFSELTTDVPASLATVKPLYAAFDQKEASIFPLLLALILVVIVGFVVFVVLRKKRKQKKTEEKNKEEKREVEKKESSAKKKYILWGIGIFVLIFIIFPIVTTIIDFVSVKYLSKQDAPSKTQEVEPQPPLPSVIPTSTKASSLPILSYKEIPEEFRKITLNCDDTSFAPKPLRESTFYCENIYNVTPEKLLSGFKQSGKNRLVLYGANSYFDCPLNLGVSDTLIRKCINASLFLDYWQMHKMSEIIGVPALTDNLYVFYVKTQKEVGAYCNYPNASACFNSDEHALYLTSPSSVKDFYRQEMQASVYEGKNHAIEYSFTMKLPQSCYPTFVHEMIHYFNNQYFGYNIAHSWFAEGITYLLDPLIMKDLCPPGPTFSNITRSEAGEKVTLQSMDLTMMDWEEPMSSAIESYTEGNKCMNAIFMEVSRHYREQGPSIIPKFYFEINRMEKSYEHDFARALYQAEDSPESLKTRLTESGCKL